MRWILLAAAAMLLPAAAQAETYRCTLHHVVRVGNNGLYDDDKDANKDSEFFLALDATGAGTLNSCGKDGICSNKTPVTVLDRDESEQNIRKRIRLLTGKGIELWSLETFRNSDEWDAAMASVTGMSTQSRFGTCRTVIPR